MGEHTGPVPVAMEPAPAYPVPPAPPTRTVISGASILKFFHIVLFVLLFAFWIVFLAGIGRSEDACVSASKRGGTVTAASGNNAAGLVPNIGQIPNVQIPDINQIIANQQGRRLMASAVEECGNQLSKDWWILFFELFCIILALALAFGSNLAARFYTTICLFWAIETTLLVIAAADFVIPAFDARGGGAAADGLRTAAAGSVALCILNFIYLICLTDKEGTLTPMFVMPAFELPKRGPRQPAGAPAAAETAPKHEVAVYVRPTNNGAPPPTAPIHPGVPPTHPGPAEP